MTSNGHIRYNDAVRLKTVVAKPALFGWIVTLVLVSGLLPGQSAYAARNHVEIRSIQMVPVDGGKMELAVTASNRFEFYVFGLKDPYRMVVDCRPAKLSQASRPGNNVNGVGFRTSQFDRDVVRIVIELERPAKYQAIRDGNLVKIHFTGAATPVAPTSLPAAPPAGSSSVSTPSSAGDNVELNISTENSPAVNVKEKLDKKKTTEKSRWKMRGVSKETLDKLFLSNKYQKASLGSRYRMAFQFRDGDDNSAFRLNYIITGRDFSDPDVPDRMRQDFTAGYEWKFGQNWKLSTTGQLISDDLTSQYGFRPQMEYRFNKRRSLSLYGGHMTRMNRHFQNRTGQNILYGAKYEHKLGDHTLQLAYRHDLNDSENARYDFVRSRYSISYKIPWNEGAKTYFKTEYSPREYSERFVDTLPEFDPEFPTLLQDASWTFTTVSHFAISQFLEIVPRYTLQTRMSNDPTKEDYILHVPSISLSATW